jgi:DNA-binding NtrC family response regulator
MIHEKRFRQDLYERLHVLTIEVQPLREHKADIPELVRHFVEKFTELQEREIPKLSRDFLATVMQSDWPGNTRELRNYIERVMALTPGTLLKPDPLPRDLQGRGPEAPRKGSGGLTAQLEALEKQVLEQTLEQCDWNQSEAARTLKMKEQTLRYRMGKHKLLEPRKNLRIRKKQR